MTEGEFIRFYKNRNNSKSHKEVREKIDLFRNVLFEALKKDKKVMFKEWGVFEKREINSRKIKVPMWEKERYTEPKEVIKFRAGKGLIKMAEGDADEQKRAGKAISKNEFKENFNNGSRRRDKRVS